MFLIEICRYLLAGNFLLFGLDGFFHFLPPPPQEPAMQKFAQNILDAKFIFPTVKVVEVIAGLLLLSAFFVKFALIMLFPIIFGICVSQFLFNWKKGYRITVLTAVPYFVVLAGYWSEFFNFFSH
jgi:uncharacterized membrane protein YphA (DoxX/SURF4 family)